ncbi:MAG: GtrA family protein [Bacteroidota bacterium]
MIELLKYLFAGFINTATGYGVFLILYRRIDCSPEVANALGYLAALCMAFLLNRFFVFSSSAATGSTALRFIIAFAGAFLLNQAVLYLCIRILLVHPEIAQIFSMIAYTFVFYILNKFYVFPVKR